MLVAEAEHRRAEFWRSEILGPNKWSGLVDTPQLRELLELGVPNAVSADRDQIDAVFWCEVCMWPVWMGLYCYGVLDKSILIANKPFIN